MKWCLLMLKCMSDLKFKGAEQQLTTRVTHSCKSSHTLSRCGDFFYCTCRRGTPCTASCLLPHSHSTCCRSGGCNRGKLSLSSKTFPVASGSGRRYVRRTAGRSSWRLSFAAPGAPASSSWNRRCELWAKPIFSFNDEVIIWLSSSL